MTTIVRTTRHKLAYKNGRLGLKCIECFLLIIVFNYERNGCNRRAEPWYHALWSYFHRLYDSTYQSELCICNCDANTLYSTLGALHVLFYRRCDVPHYRTYATSITVSIIGLPSNATAVTATTSLLLLSFLTGCRVPVS